MTERGYESEEFKAELDAGGANPLPPELRELTKVRVSPPRTPKGWANARMLPKGRQYR